MGKVTDNLNLESDTGYSGADINQNLRAIDSALDFDQEDLSQRDGDYTGELAVDDGTNTTNPAVCIWNGTNWLPVDGSGTAAF